MRTGAGATWTASTSDPGTATLRTLALADAPPHAPVDELARACDAELIVLLGDLERAWTDGLERVQLPKLGVRGNHDAAGAYAGLGVEDLHLRRTQVGGLTFCGFGGSPRYSRDGNEWSEEEAGAMLRALPAADVLLAHSPPAGVNDDPGDPVHRGSPALRGWVERHEPAWLLHGHTHPRPGQLVHRLGATRVEYVRGAAVLDVEL